MAVVYKLEINPRHVPKSFAGLNSRASLTSPIGEQSEVKASLALLSLRQLASNELHQAISAANHGAVSLLSH